MDVEASVTLCHLGVGGKGFDEGAVLERLKRAKVRIRLDALALEQVI